MKGNQLLNRLEKDIFLFDGAIGTQVQAKGLGVGEAPERWNIEQPEKIEAIHRDYLEAGADILTTNSFGGSPYKLRKVGLGARVYEVNFQAAAIARRTAGSNAYVAGSVGPTGEFLQPLGSVEPEEMQEGFKVQIKALMDGGADLIIVETMTAIEEIRLALRAAKELGHFPLIGSMTFDPTKQGFRTMMGVDIPTAVNALEEEGVDIVGSNCGNGIENFIAIAGEIREHTDLPLLVEANAGLPELIDGKTVYNETPEKMAARIPALLESGVRFVGGCCGTTPEHIRHFARVMGKRID